MVKPIGIVAMFVLLTSGPALASDNNILTRHIDLWGVTNKGALYIETVKGERYSVPVKHCPIVRTNKEYQFTPLELVESFDNADIWFRERRVRESARVTFRDKDTGEQLSCVLGSPSLMS